MKTLIKHLISKIWNWILIWIWITLGIWIFTVIYAAWTNLPTQESWAPLTKTIWNDLVNRINDIWERTDNIYSTGWNVWIWTATPTEKLDINGTIKATNYSGLASSFAMITATATVGSSATATWVWNALCPTWYTIVYWWALNSTQYWWGWMTHWYANCSQSGNGIQAILYTQVGYTWHKYQCSWLCVKN
jgi:hypothetical protein